MVVTPSHIIEYLFCPRFTWFEYVLAIPQYEGRHFKVEKGRNVHDLKLAQNKEYLRKRIGVKQKWLDQYLTNDSIRGKVDEVLLLDDGSMAPLDYKFAQYKEKIYSTYKTQLYCYACLIEENFGNTVKKGFLVYTRSNNKLVEIDISDTDKQEVKRCINEINKIVEGNVYPKATKYKKRCLTCTYRNICTK
ncbi:CRISPR-associated exonuclease, Cas4 family [Tangfeifania diversioriginum]|uniref:CRISPR-associated exonuclease Cas4 n=1 Tax=Tangfeifania diversioriginum TaxID=1168035 RepID=A0A1M6IAU7_9BACT|nr:CRISPR-associated protein Cas4 [Tangfeifania diversioriginum]SHJ31537.1 CRISPR-associated exonuclease, Cas4 family [Tangfeifania diversioriginum]